MTGPAGRDAAAIVFSVALPVRNGADYIREALDSVLSQTYQHFEIVISDNASTDATPDILAEYAAKDARVRVSRSETSLGHAANVNRSIALASNEWVKFICHDDLFHPRCLEVLADAIRALPDSVGLIGNGEEHLFANGVRQPASDPGAERPAYYRGREFLKLLAAANAPSPMPALTTALVRKDVWEKAGKFDGRFSLFDSFLWVKALLVTDYAFVGPILTVNRIHGAQVAVSARKSLQAVKDLRVFWAEFARQHGPELGMGFVARARMRMKPVAAAGAYIGIELLKSRVLSAFRMMLQTPVWWWPILPLVVFRSYRYERSRFAQLGDRVPPSLIYPG